VLSVFVVRVWFVFRVVFRIAFSFVVRVLVNPIVHVRD